MGFDEVWLQGSIALDATLVALIYLATKYQPTNKQEWQKALAANPAELVPLSWRAPLAEGLDEMSFKTQSGGMGLNPHLTCASVRGSVDRLKEFFDGVSVRTLGSSHSKMLDAQLKGRIRRLTSGLLQVMSQACVRVPTTSRNKRLGAV